MILQICLSKSLLEENSSKFMNTKRGEAFEQFKKLGVPTLAHENYKYTNLVPAFDHPYTVDLQYRTVIGDLNELFYCDVPELDTNLVLLSNGWYYNQNRELETPDGVIVCSLQEAAEKHSEILRNTTGNTLSQTKKVWLLSTQL